MFTPVFMKLILFKTKISYKLRDMDQNEEKLLTEHYNYWIIFPTNYIQKLECLPMFLRAIHPNSELYDQEIQSLNGLLKRALVAIYCIFTGIFYFTTDSKGE